MSFKDLKITTYQDSVSALPDYPSDAGITAAQLKAVFDGRTDKEIKEKFNALIEELITKFGLVEVAIVDEVETHQNSADAHEALFNAIRAMITSGDIKKLDKEEFENYMIAVNDIIGSKADSIELDKKVDKIPGKGLSTNDFTEEWKQIIGNAFNEAIYAQQLIDEHMLARDNPHNVTAQQVGALTEDQTREIAYNIFVASEEYNTLLGDVRILQEQAGDVEAALDAILAIQNELIGG